MIDMTKNPTIELLKTIVSSPIGAVGLIMVIGFILTALIVAVGGGSVLPYNPLKQNVGPALAGPSLQHPFGTDRLGRDQLSRVLYATPNALLVCTIVIGSALLIGTAIGSLSGYHGGPVDESLMRITDIFLALPSIILPISISVVLGPGLTNMMYALMATWWPSYTRMARGETLRVVQYDFIEAAKAAGLNSSKIILKHVIPNIIVTMVVFATIDFGQVIMVYAGLSYLGLSVQPPMPDWGAMVNEYQSYIVAAPWLPLFPSVVVGIVVIGFALLGDRLRDVFEFHE